MTSRQFVFGMCCLSMLTAIGCGDPAAAEPTLVPTQGIVTQAGKPLAHVTVTFYPDNGKDTQGPSSTGVTNQAGEFQLVAAGNKPGAVVGFHKVTVQCPMMGSGMSPEQQAAAKACQISANFASPEKTTLTAEVTSETPDLILDVPAN